MSTLSVLKLCDNDLECWTDYLGRTIVNMKHLQLMSRRLKELREEMGYSQDGLAKALEEYGITARQSHISNIENYPGEKLPSVPLLAALARRLETSTDYLIGITDNPLPAVSFDNVSMSDDVSSEFERMYYQLSESRRLELLRIGQVYLELDRKRARENQEDDIYLASVLSRLEERGMTELAKELVSSAPGPLRGRLQAVQRSTRLNGSSRK